MSDQRPVLVGMNNPYGSDPQYALYPYPEASAGGRLYAMWRERYEERYPGDAAARKREYMRAFDRRNVLERPTWCMSEARRQGRLLAPTLAGRRVALLGRAVASALTLPRTEWFEKRGAQSPLMFSEGLAEFTFWVIPHPSGLCREYNDPVVRSRAGDLLLALYEGREPTCA